MSDASGIRSWSLFATADRHLYKTSFSVACLLRYLIKFHASTILNIVLLRFVIVSISASEQGLDGVWMKASRKADELVVQYVLNSIIQTVCFPKVYIKM